jgi:type IV secretion system protein VirD4
LIDGVDDLLADLPRGGDPYLIGKPSAAHFELPSNLLATPSLSFNPTGNLESKLFLGVVGGKVVSGKPLRDGRANRWVEGGTPIGVGDDRHHLLVAGSRAGKGRSALLPMLATIPAATSILCIDPKGDLARNSVRFRAQSQSIGVLDPFDCSGESTRPYRCAYNPIESLAKSDRRLFTANARMIADALIVTGDFKEKHWDETSKQILTGLIAHVATHTNYVGMRDLVTVWRLASELATPHPHDAGKYWLEEEMVANDAAGGVVRAAAKQFYDRTGGEFSSVLSNLRKHLDWISFECMQDVLVGDSIDLRSLKRENVSFYVTLPAMRMDALKGWLRLIVQMALVACEEEPNNDRNACVFMLDEFFSLGRLSALETAVSQLAGFQVKLLVTLQNIGQLSIYEKNADTFVANAGVIQVMGCSDETTLKYVSGRMGQCQVQSRSSSAPTFEQAARQAVTGETWSVANHPLMTDQEVGHYFSRDDKQLRQLILRPGYHPMVLQRAFYDKHEIFRGRFQE